jgi:hypothetical protein
MIVRSNLRYLLWNWEILSLGDQVDRRVQQNSFTYALKFVTN